jgi:uncharacterized RDD family membrane protein YckC
MVIQDLSDHSASAPQTGLRLAPVADRVLAFAIDFFLFSPVVHLLLSLLLRKIEVLLISAPNSMELFSLIFVCLAATVFFVVIVQTLFLTFLGGTPGKLFLKLRVIPLSGDSAVQLTLNQAFIRSLLWVVEVSLFLVPFLEVLSHSQRRALHDRGAETMVVTLKSKGDSGPHPLEVHLIRQVMLVFG